MYLRLDLRLYFMKYNNQIIINISYQLHFPNFLYHYPIGNRIDSEGEKCIQPFVKRNKFLEWKLRKLLLIYRLLFKQCEKLISKRLLLQLISLQILQITSSNENNNDQNYEEQRQKNKINNKTIIEMQNKLIEYITCKNTNLKTKTRTKFVSFLKNLNKSTNL